MMRRYGPFRTASFSFMKHGCGMPLPTLCGILLLCIIAIVKLQLRQTTKVQQEESPYDTTF